ncbi:MAG TPA: fimbria/pilus outer membrane usher protein [Anaeromyxobacteraceae bacterium]|nr:fimbria/pilus outer membrane usher protein [Anaeromyxobacteraceae bacterium]
MRVELAAALVLLASALPPGGAAAIEPPTATPDAWQRALLDVSLNGVARERPELVLLGAGDALVPLELLQRLELAKLGGQRRQLEGRVWVSLASLAPDLRFSVDERALALRLDVRPELLGRTVVELSPGRPEGLVRRADRSAFLNYSVQGRSDERLSASLEAGASQGGNLFVSGLSRLATGAWVRGLSSVTRDEPEALRRWTLGDAAVTAGLLGGTVVLAGVGAAREFSLDPYFVRGPLPRTTGLATTPSLVDVYVNGVLVKEQAVAPGAFELSRLPVTTGSGSVRTVVRDAFGRTEELDARYYYSSGLLAPGLSDWAWQAGLLRDRFGESSFGYGQPALLARRRVGLGDATTAGGRVEATPDRVSGGASVTQGTPFGELEAGAAASAAGAARGAAGSVAWSWYSRPLNAGLFLRGQTARYVTLSLSPLDDRPLLQTGAFLGMPLGRGASVSLDASASRQRDLGTARSLTVRADLPVGGGFSLLLSGTAARAAGAPGSLGGLVTVTWALPSRVTGTAAVESSGGTSSASVGAQRSLPAGIGYGYRVQTGTLAGQGLGAGLLQYQGQFGRYELGYDRLGRTGLATTTIAGGLVDMDGRLFAARPVDQGFGLIQVPGVAGVRGFLENQEVGRTDAEGDLLVPNLQPYYGNRLSIRAADVPMSYELGQLSMLLAPPARGGALARFEARRIQAVTGDLRVDRDGAPAAPANGELTVEDGGSTVSSPVTAEGRFWLDRLSPGSHRGRVEWGGGRCAVEVEVPVARGLVAELGMVRCVPERDRVAGRAEPGRLAAP